MWNILKAAIAAVIKTNNNQEITGAILQNTLRQIVNSIGANATLAGFATPETSPGTPDGPVFWIAGPGYYDNFGNTQRTVTGSQLAFFIWNGDAWQFEVIDFAISDETLTAIITNHNKLASEFNSLNLYEDTDADTYTNVNVVLEKNIGTTEDPDWEIISTVVLSSATPTRAGLMSAWDKIALNTLPNKQDKLVSGTNIKTINNISILGSGNINLLSALLTTEISAIFVVSPVSAGYIIANDVSISSVGTTKSYDFGSIISLQAVANTGYTFDHWAINGVAVKNNPFAFQVVRGGFISAIFNSSSSNIKTVTYNVNPGGSGEIFANGSNPSSGDSLSYNIGTVIELTASAQSGYLFNHWEIDGVNVSTSRTHSFTVSTNHIVTAVFEQSASGSVQSWNFNYDKGIITVNGSSVESGDETSYPIGTRLALQATPFSGYEFLNWNIDGNQIQTNPYNFDVASANHNIYCNFVEREQPIKIYLTSNTTNTVVYVGSRSYALSPGVETAIDYTEGMILEASNSGKTWVYWYNTVTDETNTSNPLTLTGLTADIHLSAIFN